MGREEKDKTRTIAIVPLDSTQVRLRLLIKGTQIRGQFQTPQAGQWRESANASRLPHWRSTKISLQFYQGAPDLEHWAQVRDFRISKNDE